MPPDGELNIEPREITQARGLLREGPDRRGGVQREQR
jgi:hypothetical protein